jgi:hypothetical protein
MNLQTIPILFRSTAASFLQPITCFLISLLFLTGAVSAKNALFTVIAGAESHGMIDACDCEFEPGGGIAKRSSLLKTFGARNTLLLDAGGFSGGGIYDDYTAGRSVDSLRTLTMIYAMGKMNYDAACIGDDDLQYGGAWLKQQAKKAGLPLVSANCFADDSSYFFKPYLLVKKKGITIGITGLTTPEVLFETDMSVHVADPLVSLKKVWKKLAAQSDIQVLLSHCGQEMSEQFAEEFSDLDLIVNGHRKNDNEPVLLSGPVPVMQFGFQGKSFSSVSVYRKKKQFTFHNFRWYDITPELPDDTKLLSYLKKNEKNNPPTPVTVYDLYIMSQCPYGMEALGTFLHFSGIDTTVKWKIWFIGTVEKDKSLHSLHGEAEVEDEMYWLAFFSLYPEKKRDFLHQRIGSEQTSISIMVSLGADSKELQKWIEKNGATALKKHYARSTRLSVDASPTLLINNRPFEKTLSLVNLQWFHCTTGSNNQKQCDHLPQCSQNTDCRKKGKIGSCDSSGHCSYKDDIPFTFTVLTAGTTFQHPEERIIGTTEELFPAVTIRNVVLNSGEGKKLFDKYHPEALPLYLFDRAAEKAANFSSVSGGLTQMDDVYTFQTGVVPANYFPNRKKEKDNLVLMIDPFFNGVGEITTLLISREYGSGITVLPLIFTDPEETHRCTEAWYRMEEAQRWIAAASVSEETFMKYLTAYSKNRGTSFWRQQCKKAGVSADSIYTAVNGQRDVLQRHWDNVNRLRIKDPVVALIGNVETVTISGQRMLRRVLEKHLKQ